MDNILRNLQLVQIEILDIIDQVCKANRIEYSLYAGTLLGAVRHKGFIPWDDDLDVFMSRDNYNRFINAWEKSSPKGYRLQNKDNTPSFTQSFTKIRKENTTFCQEGDIPVNYHVGIFVDVFPVDRMPSGTIRRKLFFWRCMKYQLLTREYVPNDSGKIIKMISGFILGVIPKKIRSKKRQKLLIKITRYNSNDNYNTVAIEIKRTFTVPLPPDLMDEYVFLEFEGKEYPCIKKWEEYLRIKFGDYMKLPPEEERTWTHHPVILDFEHDYTELVKNDDKSLDM